MCSSSAKFLCLFLSFLLFPAFAFAETVTLKSGKTIAGKIANKTAKYVEVTTAEGITVTYYFDEVETIKADSGEDLFNAADTSALADSPADNSSATQLPPTQTPGIVPPTSDTSVPDQTVQAVEEQKVEEQKEETKEKVEDTKSVVKYYNDSLQTATQEVQGMVSPFTQEKVETPEGEDYVENQIKERLTTFSQKTAVVKNKLLTYLQRLGDTYWYPLNLITKLFIILGLHILIAYPTMLLALKMESPYALFSWIPPMPFILPVLIAEKPVWWVLLLLVPGVNILIYMAIWVSIAGFLRKSPILGFLMLVPGINILVLWNFALCPERPIWENALADKPRRNTVTRKVSSKGPTPQVFTKKPKNSRF